MGLLIDGCQLRPLLLLRLHLQLRPLLRACDCSF
jgi:hypothetical protein